MTEDHPAVQALVEEALKEVEQVSVELPTDLCAEILQKRVTEVCSLDILTKNVLSTLNLNAIWLSVCVRSRQRM